MLIVFDLIWFTMLDHFNQELIIRVNCSDINVNSSLTEVDKVKNNGWRIGASIEKEINRSFSLGLELKTGSLILYDRPALARGEAETSPARRHASAVLINLSFQAGVWQPFRMHSTFLLAITSLLDKPALGSFDELNSVREFVPITPPS